MSTLKVYLYLMFWLGCSTMVCAQDPSLSGEFRTRAIVSASLDRNGQLLIANKAGNVFRIGADGEEELVYSPERNGRPTLIEAWTTLDVLVFYEGLQGVTILNRFLSPITEIDLTPFAGFARLATYSGASNLWILDDSDFSLKMYDLELKQVVINNPLNLVLDPKNYDLTFVREYQNLLFISDSNTGILVFDNLGNYLKTISEASVSMFGFVKNEIYYSEGTTLRFIDIYSGVSRTMTVPEGRFHLLREDGFLYVINEDRVSVYPY